MRDVALLPEEVVGELIDGELVASPRPLPKHLYASTVLTGLIGPPFHLGGGGPGGWIILAEPELHLGSRPDVLVPDLAAWRRERLTELPEVVGFTLAPDWVCEVVSPSTAGRDRVKKMPIYAREGVGHLWIVDPGARTLEVFRLESGRWVLLGAFQDEGKFRAEPFHEVEFELGLLWLR